MSDIFQLEELVRLKAYALGEFEASRAGEYLRLVKFENVKPWEASMRADAGYAARIRNAEADFEIAIAALRRAQ